jgi:hypothetical protein
MSRAKDFAQMLKILTPEMLVSGVVTAVLPNRRGMVTLSTGPQLNDIMLPANCYAGDIVLLFRAPRSSVWQVVATSKQDTIAIAQSDQETTFTAVPEHLRWFALYDKVVLMWYSWPAFEGVYEVQISMQGTDVDARTWAVTSGSTVVLNPGTAGMFYVRVRAINKYMLVSGWTAWLVVNAASVGGKGNPDEVAVWTDTHITGDPRLLWQDGRLNIGNQTANLYVSNMAHHGLEISAASICQTFSVDTGGILSALQLYCANASTQPMRVTISTADASVWSTVAAASTEIVSLEPAVSINAAQEYALCVEQVNPGEYPHLYYTRWNMYPAGRVTVPTTYPDIDIAFALVVNTASAGTYTALASDYISFSDQLFLRRAGNDLLLEDSGAVLLALAQHNHSGASMMGEQLELSYLADVTDTPPNDGDMLIWDTDEAIWQSNTLMNLLDAPATGVGQNGKFLRYNETQTRFEFAEASSGGGGSGGALDDLTDVDAASPSDGQALIWNAATSKWVAQTIAQAAIFVIAESIAVSALSLTLFVSSISV